jgi:hypothetical protein
MEFFSDGGHWRCTDVGTRTVIAIKLDAPDESWYHGPPYAVAEHVMDEFDLETCYPTRELRDQHFPDLPTDVNHPRKQWGGIVADAAFQERRKERAHWKTRFIRGTAHESSFEIEARLRP